MATERKRTIKPTGQGGDYTTLSAWEAGEQADLVALDEYRIGEIDGDWSATSETADVAINGSITDSTRYLEIRAIGTARHNGKWDDTKYKIVLETAGYLVGMLIIEDPYTKVSGIQIKTSSNANADHRGLVINSQFMYATINSVIVMKGSGNYLREAFEDGQYHSNSSFINCLAIGTVYGFHFGGTNVYETQLLYNCTAVNCSYGYYVFSTSIKIAKNCIAQNCGDAYYGTFDTGTTNNISDMGDAPGTSPINGTVLFIDAANGDFRLSPYDTVAQFAGSNLYADATYAVTTDIDGNSRGSATASFDIGASHATTSIRRIMPSGGNYTSLSAWETAEQRDLPANNKIAIGEIDGDWSATLDGSFLIDGWTTDATHYIEVRAIGMARHAGKWETSKHLCRVANSQICRIYESYVRLSGLQFEITAVNAAEQCGINIWSLSEGYIEIDSCLFRGVSSTSNFHDGIQAYDLSGTFQLIISNCSFWGFLGTGNGNGGIFRETGSAVIHVLNCTAYGCRRGFTEALTTGNRLVNCLAQNCADGFAGDWGHADTTNNCSDIASDAPGSNPITGTAQFIDATSGDFHLSPSDSVARGKGINLSNDLTYPFNHDIDERERVGFWDIGADQVTTDRLFKVSKIRNVKRIFGGIG